MMRVAHTPLAAHGWHAIGIAGLAAGLLGATLLVGNLLSRPALQPVSAGMTSPGSHVQDGAEAPAAARLERQHVAIEERLSRFPAASERAAQLATLGTLAEGHGVTLSASEYRDVDSPMPRELDAIELRAPLRGSLAALRGFVAGVQREMPWLAIDRLLLERGPDGWRGELQGRLLLRRGA